MKKFILLTAFIISSFIVNFQLNTSTVLTNSRMNNSTYSEMNLPTNEKFGFLAYPTPPTGTSPHSNMTILNDQQLASQASGSGTILDPYVISNYNITSTASNIIDIQNTDKPTVIKNCIFSGITSLDGIYIYNVSYLTIENNYFENVENSIVGEVGNSIVIMNNIMLPSTLNNIYTAALANSKISNNQLYSTPMGITCVSDAQIEIYSNLIFNITSISISVGGDYNDTIASNNITLTHFGIAISSSVNETINLNYVYEAVTAISVGSVSNNYVTNNNIEYSFEGINSMDSIHVIISNNVIKFSNSNGIYVYQNLKDTISGNVISENKKTWAVWLSFSEYNEFSNNNIDSSLGLLYMDSSNFNLISGNSFLNSYANGTLIAGSHYNTISNSVFNGSADYSLILAEGSNNRVIGNIFTNANYYDLNLEQENNTVIEKNAFLNNASFGASQALDNGQNNLFLYNYWSGWTIPDANNDGIVDYPFLIDGPTHSYDMKPLVSVQVIKPNGISQSQGKIGNITVYLTNSAISTSSSTKASPGFTVDVLLLSIPIIGLLSILKKKKFLI